MQTGRQPARISRLLSVLAGSLVLISGKESILKRFCLQFFLQDFPDALGGLSVSIRVGSLAHFLIENRVCQ